MEKEGEEEDDGKEEKDKRWIISRAFYWRANANTYLPLFENSITLEDKGRRYLEKYISELWII